MDVNFVNKYNETMWDNFNSVMKQNMLLQTQVKLLQEELKKIEILEERLKISEEQNSILLETESSQKSTILDLEKRIELLLVDLGIYKTRSEEKDRMQLALNECMRKNEELQNTSEKNVKKKLIAG